MQIDWGRCRMDGGKEVWPALFTDSLTISAVGRSSNEIIGSGKGTKLKEEDSEKYTKVSSEYLYL
jgi:hypothetical protein